MVIFFIKKQKGHMDKTIDTYSMFGKEIKNTKQQWIDRWKDCTVSSLSGLMPVSEYRDLVDRIITLAGEDFERRYERENRS